MFCFLSSSSPSLNYLPLSQTKSNCSLPRQHWPPSSVLSLFTEVCLIRPISGKSLPNAKPATLFAEDVFFFVGGDETLQRRTSKEGVEENKVLLMENTE